MKNLICSMMFLVMLSSNALAKLPDVFPEQPDGRVTDKAKVFSQEEKAKLTALLEQIEMQRSQTQIAILTIESLGGLNLETVAHKCAEKWKLGRADIDNGMLILFVKNEGKLRIETGEGLEGILPDGYLGQIATSQTKPLLKQKKYFEAFDDLIRTIDQKLVQEFNSPSKNSSKETPKEETSLLDIFFWIVAVIIVIIAAIAGVGWAISTGALGGLIAHLLFAVAFGIFWAILCLVAGAIVGLIIAVIIRGGMGLDGGIGPGCGGGGGSSGLFEGLGGALSGGGISIDISD